MVDGRQSTRQDASSDQTSSPESCAVEHKSEFDLANRGAWCEILKDIVALANYGGGRLLIGVHDDGSAAGLPPTAFTKLDPAHIVDRLASYTNATLPDLRVTHMDVEGSGICEIRIGGAPYPMVFDREGSYDDGGKKQRVAFRIGTLYTRRAGKSCPASSSELRDMIDSRISARNDQLRKVIDAPLGTSVLIGADTGTSSAETTNPEMRLSTNPDAQEFRLNDGEVTRLFPYSYDRLTKYLRMNVPGFLANKTYHAARKAIESGGQLTFRRCLEPGRPKSGSKLLYSQAAAGELVEILKLDFAACHAHGIARE